MWKSNHFKILTKQELNFASPEIATKTNENDRFNHHQIALNSSQIATNKNSVDKSSNSLVKSTELLSDWYNDFVRLGRY